MEKNLLSTLYTGTRELKLTAGKHINAAAPRGVYKTCTLNTRSNPPKISYAAIVAEHLLTGRIAALETVENKSVYVELWNAEHTEIIEHIYYNGGNQCTWLEAVPENSSHIVTPFVLFALTHESEMTETKAAFSACVEKYKSTSQIPEGEIFHFCDCFYYEWKAKYPERINLETGMNQELIKQAIRTNNARVPQQFYTDDILAYVPKIGIAEIKEEEEEATSIPNKNKYDACKNGEYKIDYCWDAAQTMHIPDIKTLESYVPCESFYSLVDLISTDLNEVNARMRKGCFGTDAIQSNYVNVIVCGKPGTGKTTLSYALAATFGMPARTITISKNTEEDSFQGMTKVVEGGYKFVPTPFLDIFENGGIGIIEEGNLAHPAVIMGAIGQALVKPFVLYKDGYKEVKRHPLCVIIMTMNTGTQGSCEPSEALTSRFPHVFLMDDPEDEQCVELLSKNGYKKHDCKKVFRAYQKVIAYLTSSSVNMEDVALSVTLRHCEAALKQMNTGRTFKEALKNTICGVIAIKDINLAKQVFKEVIEPLRG